MSDADLIADLVHRLDAIADELADLAIERLRTSLRAPASPPYEFDHGDDDGTARILDERTMTRARRAIEKASGLLRSAGRSDDEHDN